jgi:hypothetical protein
MFLKLSHYYLGGIRSSNDMPVNKFYYVDSKTCLLTYVLVQKVRYSFQSCMVLAVRLSSYSVDRDT